MLNLFMMSSLLGLALQGGFAQTTGVPAHATGVSVKITSVSIKSRIVHWRIDNRGDKTILVYATFFGGPAFAVQNDGGRRILALTPSVESNDCLNSFPKIKTEEIQPGKSFDGRTNDREIGRGRNESVQIQIGYGRAKDDLQKAVAELQALPTCQSPYNAVIRWQTLVVSRPMPIP